MNYAAFVAGDFWKHHGQRKNCLWGVISIFAIMFSILFNKYIINIDFSYLCLDVIKEVCFRFVVEGKGLSFVWYTILMIIFKILRTKMPYVANGCIIVIFGYIFAKYNNSVADNNLDIEQSNTKSLMFCFRQLLSPGGSMWLWQWIQISDRRIPGQTSETSSSFEPCRFERISG